MTSTKSRIIQSLENTVRAVTPLGASLVVVTVLAGASMGVVSSTTGCGEGGSCTQLRNTTYSNLQTWEACEPQDPEACIPVAGNPKDCTGVLTCDFAVNPHYRTQAEQAVLTIGQQSQTCFLCAVPNCGGGTPMCEPVSRRCILAGLAAPSDAGTAAAAGD
jgi:hypothetical protein